MSFYKKNCSQLQEAELHFQEHNFHMKCTFFLEKKRRFFNICLCFCIKNPIIVKRTFQTVQCSCSVHLPTFLFNLSILSVAGSRSEEILLAKILKIFSFNLNLFHRFFRFSFFTLSASIVFFLLFLNSVRTLMATRVLLQASIRSIFSISSRLHSQPESSSSWILSVGGRGGWEVSRLVRVGVDLCCVLQVIRAILADHCLLPRRNKKEEISAKLEIPYLNTELL